MALASIGSTGGRVRKRRASTTVMARSAPPTRGTSASQGEARANCALRRSAAGRWNSTLCSACVAQPTKATTRAARTPVSAARTSRKLPRKRPVWATAALSQETGRADTERARSDMDGGRREPPTEDAGGRVMLLLFKTIVAVVLKQLCADVAGSVAFTREILWRSGAARRCLRPG